MTDGGKKNKREKDVQMGGDGQNPRRENLCVVRPAAEYGIHEGRQKTCGHVCVMVGSWAGRKTDCAPQYPSGCVHCVRSPGDIETISHGVMAVMGRICTANRILDSRR